MTLPLPVISDGFRLAHRYHSGDATFVNVFWILTDGTIDEPTLATSWESAYFDTSGGPTIASLQSQDCTFDGVDIIALDGISPTFNHNYASVRRGLVLTQMTAANAAFVVTWETGRRGRSNRGRTYFAGGPSASLEAGSARWSNAFVADMNTWIQTWMDNLAGQPGNVLLAQVSQRAASSPHHAAVTSFVPRQGIGTIRMRTEREKP